MDLRLNLDTIAFDDLVELGRSSIPGLAPQWTDHNVHDPGIMLIELLAWVAEAQIYSLSRTPRRDERLAYARLLGLDRRPARPAETLVWPLAKEDDPAAATFVPGGPLSRETLIFPDHPDAPSFRISRDLGLTRAKLRQVLSRAADGRLVDQTRANRRNGATYMPFGPTPAPGDALELWFEHDPSTETFGDTPIAIGVEILGLATPAPKGAAQVQRLRVSLRDEAGERPVALLEDTTMGLLRSGLLRLRLPADQPIDPRFALVVRSATGGFLRPPRIRRIGPNVLPVEQVRKIELEEEPGFGNGQPDQVYHLREGGLTDPANLEVTFVGGPSPGRWTAVEDLAAHGPSSRVFTHDPLSGELRFGNGVNGIPPPAGATLQASYSVTVGARANLPAGVRWKLEGVAGHFGENPQAAFGGRDADGLDDLQSLARAQLGDRSLCVTDADLVGAAKALADLGVARAVELPPAPGSGPGARTLVAVATRDERGDSAPETAEWLEEIRARLAPKIPLGQRLRVRAPGYADVRITASLTALPDADTKAVAEDVAKELDRRLATVADGGGGWAFGRDLTPAMVRGWLRKTEGVGRVDGVAILRDGAPLKDSLELRPHELPKLRPAPGDIQVTRAGGNVP